MYVKKFFRSARYLAIAAALTDVLRPADAQKISAQDDKPAPLLQRNLATKRSADFSHYQDEAGERTKYTRRFYCLGSCELIRIHAHIPNAPPAEETKLKKHRCKQGTTRHFAEDRFKLPQDCILQDDLAWDLRAYYRCHDLPESFVHNWISTQPIRPVRERNTTSPYLVRSALSHSRRHALRKLGTPYTWFLDQRTNLQIRRIYEPIALRTLPDLTRRNHDQLGGLTIVR
ncbi:hypothetical protein PVAG01_00871 [Phlyctema vagabunda]|uniref:Uncharacterized protein n=1 Tax=Phlyctema vagabunda TaxID=108571 RepID=A0ABR4PVH1_9HELO